MTSPVVDRIVSDLQARRRVTADEWRSMSGQLHHLLSKGNAGEYYFPFLNKQGKMQHDWNIGGHRFGMVEEDPNTWSYAGN